MRRRAMHVRMHLNGISRILICWRTGFGRLEAEIEAALNEALLAVRHSQE